MIKILFLAANPTDSTRLRLDEESRTIDQALRLAKFRDRFDLIQHWAVRVADLQGLLLRYNPDIVHFSGHGSEDSEIVLEDQTGQSQPVPMGALSRLFSVLKDNVRCVVLNACYSEEQAQAIAGHIDCVIGMSDAIEDEAAISFAASFYQALGYGRDIQTAFDLGCIQIEMKALQDQDVPQLLATARNPADIILTDDMNVENNAVDRSSVETRDNEIRGSAMAVFDQRGQKVTYQYNSAGDINFGAVRNRAEIVGQLEKLQTEVAKAAAANAIDEDAFTDVEYKLKKAVQQAKKLEPDKKSIIGYLTAAKELVAGVTTGAAAVGGLVTALTQAIDLVQRFF